MIFPAKAQLNNNILHVAYAIYMGIAYRQFFMKKYLIWPLLKSLLMVILFVALFWLSIWIFVFVRHLLLG
jgi:hypothetical protein